MSVVLVLSHYLRVAKYVAMYLDLPMLLVVDWKMFAIHHLCCAMIKVMCRCLTCQDYVPMIFVCVCVCVCLVKFISYDDPTLASNCDFTVVRCFGAKKSSSSSSSDLDTAFVLFFVSSFSDFTSGFSIS